MSDESVTATPEAPSVSNEPNPPVEPEAPTNQTLAFSIVLPLDGLEAVAKGLGWRDKVNLRDNATGKFNQVTNPVDYETQIKSWLTNTIQRVYQNAKTQEAALQAKLDVQPHVDSISVK